jgi:hypothetical protein
VLFNLPHRHEIETRIVRLDSGFIGLAIRFERKHPILILAQGNLVLDVNKLLWILPPDGRADP